MLITDYSIKFRIAAFVFILVLVITGSVSYVDLPREGPPDIPIPFIFVTAIYEGVAPSEMENLVTIPLEKEFRNLGNVKEITSSSAEGVALVTIEFTPDQDIDDAIQKVKDKISMARPDLPPDLDEPTVSDFNISTDVPVLTFALSGETSLKRLKDVAESLEDLIEAVPGVLQTTISGTREREIRVEIDLERLVAYRLPIEAVNRALWSENTTMSAGNLDASSGQKFQIRVPGEFTDVRAIEDLVVGIRNNNPIYVSDIATVRDTYKDLASISRIDGAPCVSVNVFKRLGENTVAIADASRRIIDSYNFPPGIETTVTMDQSYDVKLMLSELENNVASGFILVVLVLLLAMGFRNSLLVGVAIPFSMLISFTVLSFAGITLNMMVLFSLVLALGMLVDNAIVIVENIFRHYSEGETKIEAATKGASEVAWPVITSTLTTLAAFSPLLFWPDIMGEFMSYLPKTLICTLSASLLVAIVINPAICSVVVRREEEKKDTWLRRQGFRVLAAYERLLASALRQRGRIIMIGFGVLVLTMAYFSVLGKGVELFPEVDPRNGSVQVKYPEGTGIEQVNETLKRIETQLEQYKDIEFVLATAGSAGEGFLSAGQSGTHMGSITFKFLEHGRREGRSLDVIERIRDELPKFPGAEIKVDREKMGPPTGPPVSIKIAGDDFERLARISAQVQSRIKDISGLVDLQDDLELTRPELRFTVDRHRAALLGTDTRAIGTFLRSAVNGSTVSKFRAGEDEYDITVRLPEHQRNMVELFDQLSVVNAQGKLVPLSSLGSVTYAGGQGAITRVDQHRTITITGNAQGRGVDLILADVIAALEDLPLPKGYTLSYAGDTEEMQQAGAFLIKAFGIAVALIAIVLVIQFNSALLPGIIMVSVLLSLIGVMWGLMICGFKFGVIMTGLGVISLAGVVVNNAIVLIDCILQRRSEGMSVDEAVITAGKLRLRPVLLTAITTILGLIPMAIGLSLEIHTFPPKIVAGSETSAWWAPMAIAVIFGLAVATVLTLVMVPVMYSLSESFSGQLRWYFKLDEDENA